MSDDTPQLLFLLSSGNERVGHDGAAIPTGMDAAQVLIPYRRLKEAGYAIRVVTPDGAPAQLDPASLDPGLNLPAEDLSYLRGMMSSLAPFADDVRVTLADLTMSNFGAARRVRDSLVEAGMSSAAARDMVVEGIRISRAEKSDFADALASTGADRALVDAAVMATAQASATAADALAAAFAADPALASPEPLAAVGEQALSAVSALVVPGGRAAMIALPADENVARVITTLHGNGAVIATLGHGGAALLSAGGDAEGRWLFDGYRMVSPSADEEAQVAGGTNLPWILANALMNAGAVYDDSSSWSSRVSVDRNLITAQNHFSTEAFTDAVLAGLVLGVHPEEVSA